jgi:hypothetical protein
MDPRRLLDGEGDDFARALLRSARRDVPDHGAAARSAIALGVGAGVVGASGAATAGGVSATSAGIGLGTFGIAKWVGIGVVAGLFTAGGVEIARPSTPASPPVEARAVSPPIAREQHPDLAAKPALPSPAPLQAPREPARPGNVHTSMPASAPESSSVAVFDRVPPNAGAPAASLASEVAALTRVRSALSSRDPVRALGELEAYEKVAHGHVLAAEAGVLRAEALLQSGDRAAAAALASRQLASEPNGPHAARLRAIAAGTNP